MPDTYVLLVGLARAIAPKALTATSNAGSAKERTPRFSRRRIFRALHGCRYALSCSSAAADIAHEQIVAARIAMVGRALDCVAHINPIGRAADLGQLRDVAWVTYRNAAEDLDALRDGVDQCELRTGVFVEKQMQLA